MNRACLCRIEEKASEACGLSKKGPIGSAWEEGKGVGKGGPAGLSGDGQAPAAASVTDRRRRLGQ